MNLKNAKVCVAVDNDKLVLELIILLSKFCQKILIVGPEAEYDGIEGLNNVEYFRISVLPEKIQKLKADNYDIFIFSTNSFPANNELSVNFHNLQHFFVLNLCLMRKETVSKIVLIDNMSHTGKYLEIAKNNFIMTLIKILKIEGLNVLVVRNIKSSKESGKSGKAILKAIEENYKEIRIPPLDILNNYDKTLSFPIFNENHMKSGDCLLLRHRRPIKCNRTKNTGLRCKLEKSLKSKDFDQPSTSKSELLINPLIKAEQNNKTNKGKSLLKNIVDDETKNNKRIAGCELSDVTQDENKHLKLCTSKLIRAYEIKFGKDQLPLIKNKLISSTAEILQKMRDESLIKLSKMEDDELIEFWEVSETKT